eukprot:66004_1
MCGSSLSIKVRILVALQGSEGVGVNLKGLRANVLVVGATLASLADAGLVAGGGSRGARAVGVLPDLLLHITRLAVDLRGAAAFHGDARVLWEGDLLAVFRALGVRALQLVEPSGRGDQKYQGKEGLHFWEGMGVRADGREMKGKKGPSGT